MRALPGHSATTRATAGAVHGASRKEVRTTAAHASATAAVSASGRTTISRAGASGIAARSSAAIAGIPGRVPSAESAPWPTAPVCQM